MIIELYKLSQIEHYRINANEVARRALRRLIYYKNKSEIKESANRAHEEYTTGI